MSTFFSQRREVGEFKRRYKWMVIAVIVTFVVLVGRIVTLQIVRHSELAGIAQDNITKVLPLPASRGLIRDSKGQVVADNRPSYIVYITPQRFDAEADTALFAELMGFSAEETAEFEARLKQVPRSRWTHQVEFYRDVRRDQLAALETHSRELPGVDVVAMARRVYPFGRLGAHAIGYLNEVNQDDLTRLASEGYRARDRIGRLGIEGALESALRGDTGSSKAILPLRFEGNGGQYREIERRDPVPGNDVTLTLDMELMRAVERAFRGYPSGAAVVVDPRDGRVRALYSKPAYDLNAISGGLSVAHYRELEADVYRPLIDKAVYETYFPGSTFKPISALAALDMDGFDRAQRVSCPGYYEVGNRRFRCTSAHGEVDVRDALVQSCNIYFWKLAEQVGLDRLTQYARDFGFGEPTGLGVNSEAAGFLATREWYERSGRRFMVGFTMNTAIGQGDTRVTLIQMAMAYAAIANGGTLYRPLLVESVTTPDGEVIDAPEPEARRTVSASQSSTSIVADGLFGVVDDPSGTAHDARSELGIPIAGKTGTAQVHRHRAREGEDAERTRYLSRAHAWFAGFAPAPDPSMAVIVLVEHGGGGGRYAAPIATQIIDAHLAPSQALAAQAVRSRNRPRRRRH